MKRIIILLSVAVCVLPFSAAGKQAHSEAAIAVQYRYEKANATIDSIKYKSEDMLLQIASDESRFFSLKTEFYDSLAASPGGKELIGDMVMSALDKSGAIKRDGSGKITSITIDKDCFENVPSRGERINVYKYPLQNSMTVFDCIGGSVNAVNTWTLPADEIVWEPGDSTVTILGYECQNASADYHGRRWIAWYAPDVPISDGPWQLCGLPGLILMAESVGAEYRFTATAISECKEMIHDMYGDPIIEKCSRKDFLKQRDDVIRNPMRYVDVVAGGAVSQVYHDQIETDYHD